MISVIEKAQFTFYLCPQSLVRLEAVALIAGLRGNICFKSRFCCFKAGQAKLFVDFRQSGDRVANQILITHFDHVTGWHLLQIAEILGMHLAENIDHRIFDQLRRRRRLQRHSIEHLVEHVDRRDDHRIRFAVKIDEFATRVFGMQCRHATGVVRCFQHQPLSLIDQGKLLQYMTVDPQPASPACRRHLFDEGSAAVVRSQPGKGKHMHDAHCGDRAHRIIFFDR